MKRMKRKETENTTRFHGELNSPVLGTVHYTRRLSVPFRSFRLCPYLPRTKR